MIAIFRETAVNSPARSRERGILKLNQHSAIRECGDRSKRDTLVEKYKKNHKKSITYTLPPSAGEEIRN